jgi:tetratricopeptide (TPR) repeat protein
VPVMVACSSNLKSSSYETELNGIEQEISTIERGDFKSTSESERVGRLAYLCYRRATLTGDYADFGAAEMAIDRALQQMGRFEDLYLLRANLALKLHRVSQAKADLQKMPDAAGAQVEALRSEIAFQEGKYEEAREGYETLTQRYGTWDGFARLGYYNFVIGDAIEADDLYRRAQDEITAKEMRSYSWVELQRGMLKFKRGRYEEALAHYQRAEKAYSGSWLVEDYTAEVLGAQRRFEEAQALYKRLITRAPRPEFQQALGDLYAFMGDAESAKHWHEKALAGYEESARRGNVHYFHHLAGFYADVRQDGAEAVRWARKDAELRANFVTQDALAWALYRDNQFSEALTVMDHALSSNVQDAQIFMHAALINLADGKTDEGKQLFLKAAQINPSYGTFHVHR